MRSGMANILRHNPFFIVFLVTAGTIAASMFITLTVSAFIFLAGAWMNGRNNMAGPLLPQAPQIFLAFLGSWAGPGSEHGGVAALSHAGMGEHASSILHNATLTGLVAGVAAILKKR